MTAVRIAHAADPSPGRQPVGLVVLADTVPAEDGGHRVLSVRLPAGAGRFWRLLVRPGDRDQEHPDDDAGDMTGQLLQAAGITVTAVTITDLGPAVTATRVDIAVPGGTRQVTTCLAEGLALAVITGAPLAVDDPVMDRRTVTFRGDLRTTDVADRAGLVLRIPRHGRRPAPPDPWHDPENHFAPVTGTRDWTRHEVTAQVPADAISIIFGVFLNGRGQIELRNPQLDPHPANQ